MLDRLDLGLHGFASECSIRIHCLSSAFRIKQIGGQNGRKVLVAEAGAHCNAPAADSTATAQYGGARLGLHARPEPMCFHTVAAIRLKCALGHGNALLFPLENLRFDSISEYIAA